MATKLKVNHELVGDSDIPVTRTEFIKHGNDMLNSVINAAVSTANGKADKTYVDTELGKKADKSEVNGKADASTVAALQTAVNGKADSSTVSALSERVSTNETGLAAANTRIDNIVAIPPGSTEGNTELIDIRTGSDGKNYATAGDAVRGQVTDLKSDLIQLETKGYPQASITEAVNTWGNANLDKFVPNGSITEDKLSPEVRAKYDKGFVDYSQHNAELNETKIALNGYQHISKQAYGTKENATGIGVMVNSSGAPEVMNVDTQGLSTYHDRDVVGAYISADGLDPLYNVPMNNVTYSSTGCTVNNYSMPKLLPNMIIDTSDNNYVGIVKSYNASTGVITLEDGWWNKNSHVKGTPSGTGFWVQKTSKVWGINVNVGLPSGIKTNAAAIEAGLYNNGSTGQDRGVMDAVLLKGDGDYGVRTRGNFFYGFLADGSGRGFCYRTSNETNPAFYTELPDGKYFVIAANGAINRTIKSVVQKGTGTIELGESIIIEATADATLTLPSSAPVGTVIEVFIASSNSITYRTPSGETIWYEGGSSNSPTFSGINHSLFRLIKWSSDQWLIFKQSMASLS